MTAASALPPPARLQREFDQRMMAIALSLAEREIGDTWPNPSVGCVIAANGRIVGRGWTRSGGRPHAETEALGMAGTDAKGATAYVALEPCSHHGKTPPCVDALVAAGIQRVVASTKDPDPRVSGEGFARLRAAGVIVDEGLAQTEAERINRGFFLRMGRNRPLFALKVGASLDGRIALKDGTSQWITGESARAAGHALRARFDAILVGSRTVMDDDPLLTCRMPGYAGRPKVRIVLDRRGRVGPEHRIASEEHGPSLIYRSGSAAKVGAAEVRSLTSNGSGFLGEAVADMARTGLTRVLIEGGGTIAGAFMAAGMIDEIFWFSSGHVLGGDARPAMGALNIDQLSDGPQFVTRRVDKFGNDTLRVLERAAIA